MGKTLIAYQTLYGSTREAAREIAAVLELEFNQKVDLFRLVENGEHPDVKDYDNVVVGSCVFHGKWGHAAEEFLSNNFDDKKVAAYICAGYAGETDLYQQAYNLFLKDTVEKKLKVKPVSIEAFGGKIPKFKLPEIWTLRAQKKLPKFRSDNRDMNKVRKWAKEIGKKFNNAL